MKMLRLVATLCLGTTMVTGCTGNEPHRSVEYYLEHPQERAAKLRQCVEQAAALTDLDGNCSRARQAEGTRQPVGPVELRSVVED